MTKELKGKQNNTGWHSRFSGLGSPLGSAWSEKRPCCAATRGSQYGLPANGRNRQKTIIHRKRSQRDAEEEWQAEHQSRSRYSSIPVI